MSAGAPPATPFEAPYRMAMGLMGLKEADWLDIDDDLADDLQEKRRLLAERHDEVCVALPGSEPAQREALDLVAQHLLRLHHDRYVRDGNGLAVRPTGDAIDLAADTPSPIERAACLVQEDLCVMEQREGAWCLTAAAVCFPTRWKLADKMGKPVDAIHDPVPGFGQKLARPVSRFFDHMKAERPVWRINWSLLDDPALFQPGGHYRTVADPSLTADNAGERLWLRMERQTLRRLPETDAILFTIRVYRWPLNALAGHDGTAERLRGALETMPAPMREYKSIGVLGEAVAGYLDRLLDGRTAEKAG